MKHVFKPGDLVRLIPRSVLRITDRVYTVKALKGATLIELSETEGVFHQSQFQKYEPRKRT